jgi:Escherichia/Staphylococcus phage prohead protease
MAQKALDATATATDSDLGQFEAIVATFDLDRQGERIARGAFVGTIARWQSSKKVIPLHWNHGGDPADIIGFCDPARMRETPRGLIVAGHIDLDEERGRQVWRSLKANALGFSFGYIATQSREEGKVRVLDEIDLFEVTVTASPANERTRLLALKALEEGCSAEGPGWLGSFDIDEKSIAAAESPIRIAEFEC